MTPREPVIGTAVPDACRFPVGQRPETRGHRRETGGHRPQTGGHRPQTGGHRPQTGGHRPQTGGRRRASGALLRTAALRTLAGAAIAAQIGYPLLDGEPLRLLTITSVVLLFLASATAAATRWGLRWAATLLALSAGGGLIAEAVGIRTGVPFGRYSYAGSLGPQLIGVPVVVPLAWAMLAYPALLVGRRLARRWVAPVGGLALASWDLFLDPQMVAAGHWRWAHPDPSLPGVPGVPLTNYLGWLLVATAMMALLNRLLPRFTAGPETCGLSPRSRAADADGVAAALYLWTYAGSVLGNLVFFGRPAVALIGGITMGVVAVPYARRVWQDRR